MENDPRLTPLVASLPASVPFVGPEVLEAQRGRAFKARLGANESGFGPSPLAIAAMQAELAHVWKYGDAGGAPVRAALARHLDVDAAHIVVGEGVDGLLGNLVRLTVTEGTPVVSSAGAYPTFLYHVAGFGGALHTVPFKGNHEDPEALIAKAHEVGAKLVYISNPDNPMGSWHKAETITRMRDALPDGSLLVLDEAYIEMAPEGTAPPLIPDDPRIIRFRTFSKAYGLAGLRIGYGIGPAPLIAAFARIVNHFGINRMAQAAAAASLEDRDWLNHITGEIAVSRARIAQIAADNGLTALPSATNFVAVDCGHNGAYARRILEELGKRDIFVRMPGIAPLDRCIRISCGAEAEMALLATALPEAIRAAG